YTVAGRDGRTFPVFVTVAPLFDDVGAVRGVVAVSVDISERRRSEQRLAAQGWSVGLIWIVDRDSATLQVAQSWRDPGVPAEEFLVESRAKSFPRGTG